MAVQLKDDLAPEGEERRRQRTARRPRALLIRRGAGFVVALALVLVLALNGGGYAPVLRAEVGIAVWAAIALGLVTGFLPRSRLSGPAWITLGGFAGFAVLNAIALDWTESDERTFAELARVLQYGGLVLLAYLSLNRYTWQGAGAGFVVGVLAVPLFAVASRLFPDLLVDDVAEAFNVDRLSYPLDYWNGVACWGAMAIAAALVWSAHAERLAVRSLALAAVPFAALSVYLTYSRAGVAAVTLAVVAAVALSSHRWTTVLNAAAAGLVSAFVVLIARGQDEIANATGGAGGGRVLLALLAGGLVCAAAAPAISRAGADRLRMPLRSARLALAGATLGVFIAAAALNGPISHAWDEFKDEGGTTAGASTTGRLSSLGGSRYTVWSKGLDAFESDSLRGIGPGAFEFYWSREGDREFMRDAHSLYIEQLAELGLPGLLALLVGLGGLLTAAVAARRRASRPRDRGGTAALTAVFVVFLVYAGVDWIWELWAAGALAVGGAAVAGAGGFERARDWDLKPWLRAAAVVAVLVAGAVQIPGLVSVQRTRAADEALVAGDLARARWLADEAIEAESWAASPYQMRALVNEADGKLAQARRDINDAIDREPTNWRHHLVAARIEARAGDRPAMERDLAEARRLAPQSPHLVDGAPYAVGLLALLREAKSGGRF